jgi:hypothetical protein
VRISTLDGTVIGAGLVVGTGQVLTAASVVEAAGPGGALRAELVGVAGAPSHSATVAPGAWFPATGDGRADVALLHLDRRPCPSGAARLHRLPATPGRAVRICGYPPGSGPKGEWTRGVLAGPAGTGGEWVRVDAGPAAGRGLHGAAVVDDDSGAVIGMAVRGPRGAGAGRPWILPAESVLCHLDVLRAGAGGAPAVDPGLARWDPDRPVDAELTRSLTGWLAGRSRRSVRLVAVGEAGSAAAAALSRLIDLSDRERRPQDAPVDAGAPPAGGVELAVDAAGRTTDDVARAIVGRLGLVAGAALVPAVVPAMTIAVVGVDDAADPAALVRELMAPLAGAGVRLLLAFRRTSSPAWALAVALWPDHDRDDDHPAVVSRRLDDLAGRIAEVAAREDAALRRRSNVSMRIAAVPDLSLRAMSLRLRLASLRKATAEQSWSWLLPQLDTCEAAVDRALGRLGDFERRLDKLLGRQGELRRQLDAGHALAHARGRGGDTVLDRLHRQAHDALWRAPCDLSFAADLVAHYRRAVNQAARS